MPPTIEQLQEQRYKLIAEMSMAQQVTHSNGQSVTFRSQAEFEVLLARIDREIASASGPGPKQIVIIPRGF